MGTFLQTLKRLYKKFFVFSAVPTAETKNIYQKIDASFLGERTFFYGVSRKKAVCMKMESAPGTAEMVIKTLQNSVPQGARVLDYGCGQHQSKYLQNLGFAVHSCDILDFDIPNYTKIDPKKIRLPFADREFDVCIVSEVIEHVESPWQLLLEAARVTRKTLIVTTPNTVSKKSRKDFYSTGFLYWFAPRDFSYHISPVFAWQMELFCKRHGFVLQQTLGNHHAFTLHDGGEVLEYAEALIFKIDLKG